MLSKKEIIDFIHLTIPAICWGLMPLIPLVIYYLSGGK